MQGGIFKVSSPVLPFKGTGDFLTFVQKFTYKASKREGGPSWRQKLVKRAYSLPEASLRPELSQLKTLKGYLSPTLLSYGEREENLHTSLDQ